MKVLYFTATGNNLYVAKRLGGECYSIPKLIKEGQYELEDEKIGIVCPTYFLGVPKIVEEFLNRAKLKSNYVFAILSYGFMPGAAARHLLEIGKRNGIEFSYINGICMVDNYLPMFDMNKELEKEPKKNIEENLSQIINDIKSHKKYINKGSAAWTVVRSLTKKQNKGHFEKNFLVESSCSGCGICEKVCPVDNITVVKKPAYKENCQGCLACINHCPVKAIKLKKEKGTVRFINKNVTVKEIIDANN